jgi:hypothetical protein
MGDEVRIAVSDINGREVLSKQVSEAATITIDVSNLPAGVYILSAIDNSKTLAPVRFVIQH